MRKSLFVFLFLSLKGFSQFTPGNLVIYRVGDGSATLTNIGTPVFLDEYTPTGQLVKSTPMPTKASGANKPLIASGTATSEGMLNRSSDGRFLTLTGYAQEPGGADVIAGTTASSVNRVIGVVDYLGNINTSTALSDYSSKGSPRSAVTDNGTNLWMVGAFGGVRYATTGAATSAVINSDNATSRIISIFNNQLYISMSTKSGKIGAGLPTSGKQLYTDMPGLPSTANQYQFQLFEMSPDVPGADVLYVADQDLGLSKYSLDAATGEWKANGSIGVKLDYYRGLTGIVNNHIITLYSIRKGGRISDGNGGELVTLNDASGYNGALTGTPVVLATAGTNMGFRGIAFSPKNVTLPAETILPVEFSNVKAAQVNSGVQISFTNQVESDVAQYTIERSVNAKDFTPVVIIKPTQNNGGKAQYAQLDKTFTNGINFYRIKGEETSGKTLYSAVVKITISLGANTDLNLFPNPVQGSVISWEAGLPKGIYKVQLTNSSGQIVYSQTINHSGGSLSQTINLPSTVKKGMYTLQVNGADVRQSKKFLKL